VHEHTTSWPTSLPARPAWPSAADSASLPNGSASTRKRSMRWLVDQRDGSSTIGFTTPWRVRTPELAKMRLANPRATPR
jgi:hypothetical protein